MSKPGKPAIRIVESGNSESDQSTPSSLAGIRQLPDGSLEYRADASDGTARWLPLSSPIRVLALTRDGDNRNWGRLHRGAWTRTADRIVGQCRPPYSPVCAVRTTGRPC